MASHNGPSEANKPGETSSQGTDRRGFLKQVAAGAAVAVGTNVAADQALAADEAGEKAVDAGKMPMIKLGKHQVSRLVAGSNPVAGYSHSTRNLAQHMREYFTPERTLEFAKKCEKLGINTWQTSCSRKILQTLKHLREQGSDLQWVCLTSARPMEPSFEKILALKPIAIVHHGGVTDMSFRMDRQNLVQDFLKKVRDAGVLVGMSSHNPANIAYAEEKGWDTDFYMACFYNVMRPAKEIREKLGSSPLGEPFLDDDRIEMTKVVRQTTKPCLGFKILAAGRLTWTSHSVEQAFAFAFKHVKKTDGVIVGMYPKFSDEVTHNVQLTHKYGMLA